MEVQLKELKKRLPQLFSREKFSFSEEVRYAHSFDASRLRGVPEVVFFPETEEDVTKLVKLCFNYRVPIFCRGAGTATTGSSLPMMPAVVISFSKMNRILELNQEERVLRVQPGVLTGKIKEYLRKYQLFYPPDPASYKYSTIGGNVATGAGGPRCFKYGTTRDYVLALRVVLADGRVLKTAPYTLKHSAYYNLTPIFVGSEGTLGIFTEIVLKVVPLPESSYLFLVGFSKEEDALTFINRVIKFGITPSAAEFVDKTTLKALSSFEEARDLIYQLGRNLEALLFLELDGEEEKVRKEVAKVKEFLKEKGLSYLGSGVEPEIESLWEVRRCISPSLRRLGSFKVSDDVTIPRRYSEEFLRFLRRLEGESGIFVCAFGHAGDGNFHVNLITDDEKKRATVEELRKKIIKQVLSLGGTSSGEHGIGYTKKTFLSFELDEVQKDLMKKLKKLFDPYGILSPGVKVVDE